MRHIGHGSDRDIIEIRIHCNNGRQVVTSGSAINAAYCADRYPARQTHSCPAHVPAPEAVPDLDQRTRPELSAAELKGVYSAEPDPGPWIALFQASPAAPFPCGAPPLVPCHGRAFQQLMLFQKRQWRHKHPTTADSLASYFLCQLSFYFGIFMANRRTAQIT